MKRIPRLGGGVERREDTTLFLPHPFTGSERLVNLYQNDAKTGEPEGVSYPAFLDLQ